MATARNRAVEGRADEARAEFERAAFMAKNTRERDLLLARAKACK